MPDIPRAKPRAYGYRDGRVAHPDCYFAATASCDSPDRSRMIDAIYLRRAPRKRCCYCAAPVWMRPAPAWRKEQP